MNSVVTRLSRRLLLPLMFGWSSFAFAADQHVYTLQNP